MALSSSSETVDPDKQDTQALHRDTEKQPLDVDDDDDDDDQQDKHTHAPSREEEEVVVTGKEWSPGRCETVDEAASHDLERLQQQQHDDDHAEDDSDAEDAGGDGDGDGDNAQDGVLGRVLSRITSRSSYDPGPPPDGGWVAWSQCFCAHIVIMNTWGFINSFGTFQTYYTSTLALPPSAVSWLGSIAVFLLFFVGAFTGRLVDAGFFRAVLAAGTVLLALGIFAVSASTRYWQLLLAQGVTLGLADGCLFCPVMAVVSTYFDRRRAIALGVVACGSATGGLVFPTIVRQLLPQIGFPWTIRVIGFIQVSTMLVVNVLARPRVKPRKAGPIVDWDAFKDPAYTFYAAGAFFCFWGVYFAFFYVSSFARQVLDPPFSYPDSLNLLLLLNGLSIPGRLIPNYLADRLGPINVYIPAAAATSLVVFLWMCVSGAAGMYAWSALYGLVAGGIQSLFPAALSSLTTDPRRAGVRMGMIFTIVSFAVLTGPPLEGAIISAAQGPRGRGLRRGYDGAQAFAGAVLAVGTLLVVAAKVARMRKTGEGWMGKI